MKVLVTGGGGFLGSAVCRLLRARGDAVLSVGRRRHAALEALGVQQVQLDISQPGSLRQVSRGVDAVIHCAAKAGAWGSWDDYHAANVVGTEQVLDACRLNGISRLVHTSTPSVVHAGGDLEGVDESVPHATHFRAHYPHTKAIAERLVLAANEAALSTVALRPHLIWGPGDTQLLPRIVARAHVDALDRLGPGAACAGRAYFISQGEPIHVDEMINGLLRACDLPPESRRVPYALAFAAGAVLEAVYGALRLEAEPPMTRFVAEQLATAHWFDISAARRDLGYQPAISTAEGLLRLAQWWRSSAAAGLGRGP